MSEDFQTTFFISFYSSLFSWSGFRQLRRPLSKSSFTPNAASDFGMQTVGIRQGFFPFLSSSGNDYHFEFYLNERPHKNRCDNLSLMILKCGRMSVSVISVRYLTRSGRSQVDEKRPSQKCVIAHRKQGEK